jgi:hypothetical protein
MSSAVAASAQPPAYEEGDLVLKYGLPPPVAALPAIRVALKQLTAASDGDVAMMKEYATLLFAAGADADADDALLIWRAKDCGGMDAGCSIDVQLLALNGGGGDNCVTDAFAYFDALPDAEGATGRLVGEGAKAAAYIRHCVESGDFDNINQQLAWYKEYYA